MHRYTRTRPIRTIASAVGLTLVLSSLACSDDVSSPPPGSHSPVIVSPISATLAPGDTVTFRNNCICQWASSDTNVAEVNASGLVRAGSPGTARITARLVRNPSYGGSAIVVVRQP